MGKVTPWTPLKKGDRVWRKIDGETIGGTVYGVLSYSKPQQVLVFWDDNPAQFQTHRRAEVKAYRKYDI
jgi:hypothetical protein